MSVLAVIVATPLAIWLVDRVFCRGEFAALAREAVDPDRRRLPKRPRIRRTTAR